MATKKRYSKSAMVKCLLCETQGIVREFKSKAGLAGHIQISHPGAVKVDGTEIKARLDAMEAGQGELLVCFQDMAGATRDAIVDIVKMLKVLDARTKVGR